MASMDIVAHGWWLGVGFGAAALAGHTQPTARTTELMLGLALAPDLIHLLPVAIGELEASGNLGTLSIYALALPGAEPPMSATVAWWAHHLHCIFHSAVVATGVTLALRVALKRWWLPLLGWWSHIVIDVFTHSPDFYPSPVLYPFTYRGFDGVAWNRPVFQVLNYSALVAVTLWLLWRWQRSSRDRP
ncbi:MAG: hypothetical protein MUF44_12340 [Hydrogenophaga sp.]|jgi:hypothetical protein|nr:hypothetical protein [Hydrogenophaga sp.]